VHLNPVRAQLLGTQDRLLSYPWSSLGKETALPIKNIAARGGLGTSKGANSNLHVWLQQETKQEIQIKEDAI
jgi:hypothetical protein